MGLSNSKNYDYDDESLLRPLSRDEVIQQSLILSGLADRNSFGEAGSISDWGKEYKYKYSENDMKIIRKSLHLSGLM
jgi:hypothetical protein|tara:strand:+ start:5438 stop:5668 length:231 start_codon:yes stop_codon:yes gene_type:complete